MNKLKKKEILKTLAKGIDELSDINVSLARAIHYNQINSEAMLEYFYKIEKVISLLDDAYKGEKNEYI